MSRAEHTAELTRLRAAASELLTSSDNVIAALHNEAAGYDAAGTSVYERNAKARIVLASLLGYGATEPAVSYDAARIERIAAIRKSLVTDADCVALAQWIDDEICALGMRLVALAERFFEIQWARAGFATGAAS